MISPIITEILTATMIKLVKGIVKIPTLLPIKKMLVILPKTIAIAKKIFLAIFFIAISNSCRAVYVGMTFLFLRREGEECACLMFVRLPFR